MISLALTFCGFLVGVICSYLKPRFPALILSVLRQCTTSEKSPRSSGMVATPVTPPAAGTVENEFRKDVITVTDGVHVAIGFGLANSIMMEGDDGVVIVDVSESVEAGRAILAEFRRITSKPIKAIIYTHFHADHCYGTEAFIEDPENPPMIVAHQKFDENLRNFILQASGAAFRRAMRQFGTLVPDDVKRGTIGSYLKWRDEGFTMGLLLPTHVQEESHQELMIAGIQLQLIHMPGETPDHLCVYLPKRGVLIPGDNIYKAFPNLYAIRGSPVRDYQ